MLDRIAGKSVRPETATQVQAMGMGGGTDADFRSIYGEHTFDPTNGGWSYKHFSSYTLPEFL